MKNNRLIKIAVTVLAIATVFCVALSFTTGAEESVKPEIISQNVAYEGDFALMYAVKADTATGPVDLYLYYEEPTADSVAAKKYTANAPENILIHGETVSAFVFKTEGVSAKDMADVFYVQAIDADGDRSAVRRYSVGEYLYERLATPGITEAQENLYYQSLYFGAAAQAVLAPSTTPVTSYRYVNVTDGTLADGYNTGIYPIGTSLTPSGDGVSAWKVVSYADDKSATEENIATGESFTLSGITFVTPTDLEVFPEGTLTFEGSTALPSEIGKSIKSSGGAVSVVKTTRGGKNTNAVKFTTAAGALDTLILKPTKTAEVYNTVAFDFDINLGNSAEYEVIIRDTAETQVFRFVFARNGNFWKLGDASNTSVGNNFWAVNELVLPNEWVNVRIEITPDPVTKMDVLSIYCNGTAVTMGVSGGKYYTVGGNFFTADSIAQLDLRSSNASANDIYLDNVLVEKYNKTARPLGSNGMEDGVYPSNISEKVSEVITDTVYGESSKVLYIKPDSDGTSETYNIYANNAFVSADTAEAVGFAADMKFVKQPDGENIAYDFMIDGYVNGASSTSAVYWLRFVSGYDSASGTTKVYIQNQKNTSEKFEVGTIGEYFYFQAAYTVVSGVPVVHIMSNGVYVGTFTVQQNAGSCPITSISNLRIRTMSSYTYSAYLDNIFVGLCYIPEVQ